MSAETGHHVVGGSDEDQERQRLLSLPRTSLGRWSTGLFVMFWFLMAVFFALLAAGVAERGNDTFAEEWPLFITIGAAAACGIASAATGLIAFFTKRERSIIVLLATLWGLLVAFFFAAEILFPH